ncbi:hypothetical protein [Pantoea anthophila]
MLENFITVSEHPESSDLIYYNFQLLPVEPKHE